MMETFMADEIIEEIHAVRRQHAAAFDFDIQRIINDLKESERKHTDEGWPLINSPEAPPPDGSFRRVPQKKAA
jgi:hypothetical protein